MRTADMSEAELERFGECGVQDTMLDSALGTP